MRFRSVAVDTRHIATYNQGQMDAPITQALVAIGGKGTRLGRPARHATPKSFIRFGAHPSLYWTLRNMRSAGIRRVVLAGESRRLLIQARRVARQAGFEFSDITTFTDVGAGVHGIPTQAHEYLDSRFLFDAGHSMCPTDHYWRLRIGASGVNHYSVFREQRDNTSRTRVRELFGSDPIRRRTSGVVALPYALSSDWAELSASSLFNIRAVLMSEVSRGHAAFVSADFEPEFDLPSEHERTKRSFWLSKLRLELGRLAILRLASSAIRSSPRHAADPLVPRSYRTL